jgi:hypothetical protein
MPMWLAGLVGGIIAGVVMLGGIMTLAPFRGYGEFFTPPRLVAATVQGEAAANGGMGAATLGLTIHLTVAAVFGLLFAMLMAGLGLTSFGPTIRFFIVPFSGMLYSLSLFGGSEYLVLPFINRPMFRELNPLDWALMHLLYGAVLGWFVALMA